MKASESLTINCTNCDTEFELTLEPKAKGLPQKDVDDNFVEQTPEHCPFCGFNDLDWDQ